MKTKMLSLLTVLLIGAALLSGCGSDPEPETSNMPTIPEETNTPDGDTVNQEPVDEMVVEPSDDGPAQTEPVDDTTPSVTFIAGSPVSVLTDEDIAHLGIDLSGTDREIAEAIKKWQEDNMIYAFPEAGYIDVSDPIRWNYFLPGIWPSRDIIYDHTDNGRIYGICEDYATIYSSIANYYGLETRIANSLSKPSDGTGTPAMPGMHPDEYDRNKSQLLKYGLDYSYDAVRSVAEETPTHYWAEVLLDGEWVIMDATQKSTGGNTQAEYIDTGDFVITDWMSRDMTAILETFAPAVDETDDLGQVGRASSIGEIMQGFALAPYFNEAADAVAFIGAQNYMTAADIREMNADKAAYEACSGEPLYLVSYLICDGDGLSGQAWLDRYEETCGETLDLACGADIISGY